MVVSAIFSLAENKMRAHLVQTSLWTECRCLGIVSGGSSESIHEPGCPWVSAKSTGKDLYRLAILNS